jgi:pSer/pThr/pTyr-binding forkhead associated (FHA) protein
MVLFRKKKENEKTDRIIQLTIIQGNNDTGDIPGKIFDLSCGNNYIGRDPLCEIILGSGTVSRRHANLKVSYNKTYFSVTDLGSSNGVLIYPKKLLRNKKAPLKSGDEIQIGEILFKLQVIDDGESNLTMSMDVDELHKDTKHLKK